MAPGMWTLMIAITGATIWGTLGVIAVVAVGLVLLLLVRTPADRGTI
jgi:MFS transporter, UMF1 family